MGWNGSDGASAANNKNGGRGATRPTNSTVSSKPPYRNGIIAGLLVVAVGVVVVMLVGRRDPTPPPEPVKEKPKAIAEAKPAVVTNKVAEAEPEKPVRRTKKGTPIPDKVHPDARGILRYPNGQRWVDPNDLHIVEHPHKRRLFTHTSDNQIAIMLQLDPSKMMPQLIGKRRPYDQRFVEDFKKALENPEVFDKNDTPEEAEVRKAVMEVKTELAERMRNGEDIAQIMNDTQKELDRLCQYQNELKKELRKIQYDENVSDDDYKDYVAAANKMLESQGLKGITMPKILTRQATIQRMKEHRARKEAEANKNK